MCRRLTIRTVFEMNQLPVSVLIDELTLPAKMLQLNANSVLKTVHI